MDTKLRAHVERLLLAERDRTANDLRRAEADEAEANSVATGTLARAEMDPADAAAEVQQEEADVITASRASAHLVQIDDALRTLAVDADALAFCMRCGYAVERARLELVPWSRLCALCARADGRAHPELR